MAHSTSRPHELVLWPHIRESFSPWRQGLTVAWVAFRRWGPVCFPSRSHKGRITLVLPDKNLHARGSLEMYKIA